MSEPLYDELADLLSETMIGAPYDSRSLHDERFRIDHLVDLVREWGEGTEVTRSQLRRAFWGTGIDIDLWIAEREAEGVYTIRDGEE